MEELTRLQTHFDHDGGHHIYGDGHSAGAAKHDRHGPAVSTAGMTVVCLFFCQINKSEQIFI